MATALLLRRSPDGRGDPAGSLRAEGETASAAAIRLATTLRDSYLPMQGPPGTGKTYTAAEQILELIAHGRTVGITGPSHAVIHRLIDKVYKHANGVSALEHILGDRATMLAGAGLLLDQTYRMHPDLCRFTSEAFYDGKLHGIDGLGRQEIAGSGAGLRVVEVPHQGNTNASPEEAREVARLTTQLTRQVWHDKDGTERPVTPSGILIVTPCNAQIRAIQTALAASGQAGFKVGTVDKFQGREALAIIVASPDLIRVSCRTPQQMTLANALCQAGETRG